MLGDDSVSPAGAAELSPGPEPPRSPPDSPAGPASSSGLDRNVSSFPHLWSARPDQPLSGAAPTLPPRAVPSLGGFPWLRVRGTILPSVPRPQSKLVLLSLRPWPPWEERERPEGRALAFLFGRVTPTLFLLAHSRCSRRHAEITDDGGHPGGARAAGAPSERPQTPRRPRLTSVPSPPAGRHCPEP